MRVNQRSMLADLNCQRVLVFLMRIWLAARAVLPRL